MRIRALLIVVPFLLISPLLVAVAFLINTNIVDVQCHQKCADQKGVVLWYDSIGSACYLRGSGGSQLLFLGPVYWPYHR